MVKSSLIPICSSHPLKLVCNVPNATIITCVTYTLSHFHKLLKLQIIVTVNLGGLSLVTTTLLFSFTSHFVSHVPYRFSLLHGYALPPISYYYQYQYYHDYCYYYYCLNFKFICSCGQLSCFSLKNKLRGDMTFMYQHYLYRS